MLSLENDFVARQVVVGNHRAYTASTYDNRGGENCRSKQDSKFQFQIDGGRAVVMRIRQHTFLTGIKLSKNRCLNIRNGIMRQIFTR